tara:strand:- start:2234 stop:2689 length:456 start_codon:yes stop_codon:yes gene_type:complete
MGNPPLTYFLNIMTAFALVSGGDSTMMIPANIATLLPGFLMSNRYNEGLSKKYLDGKKSALKYIDIATHWVPSIVLLLVNRNNRIKKRDYALASLLPWLYFTIGTKQDGSFGIRNPFQHVAETYPGVPYWIFPFWYVGLACARKVQVRSFV